MSAIVPYNLIFAIIILVSSLFNGDVRLIVWGIVAAVAVLGPLVQKNKGLFAVSPWHFLERHYLILVIALGETIASTGRAAIDEDLTSDVVLTMVLALGLTVLLWYSYVKDDTEREEQFHEMGINQRDQAAKAGFYWSHFAMFLGIILLAVVKIAIIHDPMQTLDLAHRITLYVAIVLFGYDVIYFNRLFFKVSWKRLMTHDSCRPSRHSADCPLFTGNHSLARHYIHLLYCDDCPSSVLENKTRRNIKQARTMSRFWLVHYRTSFSNCFNFVE